MANYPLGKSATGGLGIQVVKTNLLQGGIQQGANRYFTGFQTEMKKAHAKMAENCAILIRKELEEAVKAHGRPQIARSRRGQGAEALPRAITAEKNRTYGFQGFTVMVASYLDSLDPVREYWRIQDAGTSQFVGKQYRGFFLSTGIKRIDPREARYPRDPLMIIKGSAGGVGNDRVARRAQEAGGAAGFGGGAYGTRRGTTKTNVIPTQSLFAASRSRNNESGYPLITIRRRIRGYHYIDEGFARWVSSQDEYKQTKDVVIASGGRMQGRSVIIPPRFYPRGSR